jgi:hypothetical protein
MQSKAPSTLRSAGALHMIRAITITNINGIDSAVGRSAGFE